jgi:pimeloyl-ACP methyl ester carboxylesterase
MTDDVMPEGRRIEVGGLSMYVVDEGEGEAVVLLHGFPDTSDMWRHQVPALLEAGYRVVAPDLRGRGRTDRPEEVEAYLLGAHVGDVTGLMDVLDIDRAHVVGHDWGAPVGWMLASFIPERVRSLVAVSVGHPAFFLRPSIRQIARFWYIMLFQFAVAEEIITRDDWQFLRAWGATSPDRDRYVEDLARPGALVAGLNWYRANLPPEIFVSDEIDYPRITCPVMGVYGAGDMALTEEPMTASAELVEGDWRYERFDDCGHWLTLEAPERFNSLLLDFIGG